MSSQAADERQGSVPGFDPMQYIPRPVPGVVLYDRGEAEYPARWVLTRPDSEEVVVLSLSDKLVWEMFDGRHHVNDICSTFLTRHRTLALTRIYSLIQQLWEAGFLQDDPRFARAERVGPTRRWPVLTDRLKLPLPGTDRLAALLGRCLPAGGNPAGTLIWLLAVLLAAGCAIGFTGSAPAGLRLLQTDLFAGGLGLDEGPRAGQGYGVGLLLLLVLHLGCSLFRSLLASAVESAMGAPVAPLRLVFSYGIPCISRSSVARQTLPVRGRLLAGLAGIASDLLIGGVAVTLLRFVPLPVPLPELLWKLSWVAYCRAFMHFSPFLISDFTRTLAEVGNLTHFRRHAVGFLRHNLVPAMFGDFELTLEQKLLLVWNLVTLAWLGLAARLGVDTLARNQQALRDLTFMTGNWGPLSLALALLVVLPLLICLVVAGIAGTFLAINWLRYRVLADRPSALIGVGTALLVLVVAVDQVLRRLPGGSGSVEQALYGLALVVLLVGLLAVAHHLEGRLGSVAGTKLIAVGLILVCASLLLILPRLSFMPVGLLRLLALVLAGSILLYHLLLFMRAQHLPTYTGTRFFLPDLVLTVGTVLLLVQALQVFAHAGADGLPRLPLLPQFLGLSLVVLGVAAFFAPGGTPAVPLPSLLLEAQTLSQPELALIRVCNHVLQNLHRQVSVLFGAHTAQQLTQHLRLRLRLAHYEPHQGLAEVAAGDRAAAVAQVRQAFAAASEFLRETHGEQIRDELFRRVLERLHLQAKDLLHKLVFPGTPWANLFAQEIALGPEERRRQLEAVSLFNACSEDDRDYLANHLVLHTFPAHAPVVREGEMADACFFLIAGGLQVEELTFTGTRRILAVLQPGAFFGESALLEHAPRTATVRATSFATVLSLHQDDFQVLAARHPELAFRLRAHVRNLQTLLRVPIFSDLPANVLRGVLPRITSRRYQPGETVVRAGERGNEFFLVQSGLLGVFASQGEKEEKICDLGTRDYFGEIALLRDIPRTATVRCETKVELLILAKEDFMSLLQASEVFATSVRAMGDTRLQRR